MQDRQLYEQILGITAPWFVDRVELKSKDGEVQVFLAHQATAQGFCPECGRPCPLHDHQPERTWRHLDTCQYQTSLHAAVPRTSCPEHGARTGRTPWAEPLSRFTLLFERLAIDWLQAASQQAVADRLGLSWDEVHGIMRRAVERGLKRRAAEPVPYLGVDEKAPIGRLSAASTGEAAGIGLAVVGRLRESAELAGKSVDAYVADEKSRLRQQAIDTDESDYCLEPEEFSQLADGVLSGERLDHYHACPTCQLIFDRASGTERTEDVNDKGRLLAKAAAASPKVATAAEPIN